MNPAPYTPVTLDRIRRGANAAQLGWDEQRYQRVCAKHGIPVVGVSAAPASPANVEPPAVAAPADDGSSRKRRYSRPVQPTIPDPISLISGDPQWNPVTGIFSSGGASITITGRVQGKLLTALVRAYRADPLTLLSRDSLANAGETTWSSVGTTLQALSTRLHPVGWSAPGFRGGGGYRLQRWTPLS